METKSIDNKIRIFTDGSISSQKSKDGIGTYCATFIMPGGENPRVIVGSASQSSIGRMELSAINEALHHLVNIVHTAGLLPAMLEVEAFTDSEFVYHCAIGEKKRLRNLDLWASFDELGRRFGSLTIHRVPRNQEPAQANSDLVAGVYRRAIERAMDSARSELKAMAEKKGVDNLAG